jgi:hypothetical protein
MREVRCDMCGSPITGDINRLLSWLEDSYGKTKSGNKFSADLCHKCIGLVTSGLWKYKNEETCSSEPVDPTAIDTKNPERCSSYTPSCQTTPCSDCDPSICLE